MAEYIEEFHQLGARTNLMENEQRLIARFVGGLRFDIKEKVKLQPFFKLFLLLLPMQNMLKSLLKLVQKRPTRRGPWDSSNNKKITAINYSSLSQATKDQEKERTLDPSGKKEKMNNKKQAENLYQWPNLSKCFCCGQTSHLSNACPKRKTVAILDDDGDSNNDQEEDFDQDEEALEPDEGERLSCVLQSVLIAPKEDNFH